MLLEYLELIRSKTENRIFEFAMKNFIHCLGSFWRELDAVHSLYFITRKIIEEKHLK